MRPTLLFLMLCITCSAVAQVERPISFRSEMENRMIKEDDSGKYFVASGDTTNVVYLDDGAFAYKLFNKDNVLLAEGGFSDNDDEILREHKWTEYYENGNVKNMGFYYKGNPVGIWEKFYPSGKLKSRTSFGILVNNNNTPLYGMSGPYYEYFENGNIKVYGFYGLNFQKKSIVYDTIKVTDPTTGEATKTVQKREIPTSAKFGTWEYYNSEGVLEKKEENN